MGKNNRIIDLIMKLPTVEVKPLLLKLLKIKPAYLIAALAVVAVPAVFLAYGFVHMVGTQKVYCLNCHVNQRNVDFWRQSKLHPDIACPKCHDVDKGVWNAAFHFNFSAKDDAVNPHCVGCHKDDMDRPVGIDAKKTDRPLSELIRIPHAKHISELGIKCTYCHANIFHDRRPAGYATYRPTMDTCYTCHDEKTTACDSCHPKGLPSGLSMSGKVGGGRMAYNPPGAGAVTFDHKRHAAKGLACDSCHTSVFQMTHTKGRMTMARMYGGKDCGHCHDGKAAFASTECGRCHASGSHGGGTIAYPGGGSGKVLFSHDKHLGFGLTCGECHSSLFGLKKTAGAMKMDQMTKGKLCGGCHNGKKAFSSEDCAKCHQMG
ncbi:MAG: c(7)-type cytochrome triheme domain-containing protein [Nitrospirota bacterium]